MTGAVPERLCANKVIYNAGRSHISDQNNGHEHSVSLRYLSTLLSFHSFILYGLMTGP